MQQAVQGPRAACPSQLQAMARTTRGRGAQHRRGGVGGRAGERAQGLAASPPPSARAPAACTRAGSTTRPAAASAVAAGGATGSKWWGGSRQRGPTVREAGREAPRGMRLRRRSLAPLTRRAARARAPLIRRRRHGGRGSSQRQHCRCQARPHAMLSGHAGARAGSLVLAGCQREGARAPALASRAPPPPAGPRPPPPRPPPPPPPPHLVGGARCTA